jgi:tRNA A58 N-methylase Trm61
MFSGHYEGWRKSRISTTLDLVQDGFFDGKSILEVGAGYADVGNYFQTNFDCRVTSYEGRREHVEVIKSRIESGLYSPKLIVQTHMDSSFASSSHQD